MIRSSVVNVDEDIPGGTIDLRLRNNPSSLQGTTTDLPDRRPVSRPSMNSPGIYTNQSTNPNPKGTVPVVEIPYKELPKVTYIIPEDYDKEDSSTIQLS